MSESVIAAALDLVEGVTGYAAPPATPKPGDAWPVLGQLERGPGCAWLVRWRVLYVLPQDERQAAPQIIGVVNALTATLRSALYVESAVPVDIQTDQGTLLGLQLEGISE